MVQGLPIQLVATLIAAIALLLVGIGVLCAGLRGRRIDDHPVCRRCRFDLIGLHRSAKACPECGADLARRGAVRHGQRRRVRSAVWAGAVALLLIPAVLIGGYAAARARWSHYRILPTSWLMSMADPASASGGEAALHELARRAGLRSLDSATFLALVDRALERQANPDLPWSTAWGDALGEAFSQGSFSNEELERYIKGAMSPAVVLRSPVAAGEDQWPVGFEIAGARVGSRSYAHPAIKAVLQSAEVGGVSLDLTGRGPMSGAVYLHAGTTSRVEHHLPLSVDPGRHPVRLTWLIEMQNAPSAAMMSGPAIASWPLVLEGEVEVLPAGSSIVPLVADESLREQIEAMVVPPVFTWSDKWGSLRADSRFILRGKPPMPLAFDIYCRARGSDADPGVREWLVGSISIRDPVGEANAPLYGELPGFDTALTSVDLILRPSPAEAARDPGIDRIWDGEIILLNVPITPPAQPAAPAPGG